MRRGEIDWRRLALLGALAVPVVLVNVLMISCDVAPTSFDADGGAFDGGASTPGPADTGTDATRIVGAVDAGAWLSLSSPLIEFSAIPCGMAAAESVLTLANPGARAVTVSATTIGTGFAAAPSVLTINAGASGALTVTASVPTSAPAGTPMAGSLSLASSQAGQATITVPLSATPSGALLAFAPGEESTFAFPVTEVGYPTQLSLTLVNTGNAPATFAVSPPSDPRFSIAGDAGGLLAPGAAWTMSVSFTAQDTSAVYATSAVKVTGVTCASSLETVTFSGRGTTGEISGWPATVDFGPADCGGAAPAERSFTLTNTGAADAHIALVTLTGAPGFTTSAQVGRPIPGNGGALDIRVDAPSVPAQSASGPITATLTLRTDAETSPHEITLTVEPNGAILAFDSSGSPGFGSFGQVPLLGSASQPFNVLNAGNGPAHVTLTASPNSAFAVSTPAFAIDGAGTEAEVATFAPTIGGDITGSISMTATGVLCAPLPASIPLSGASGALPEVSPTSLSFGATCGGGAPAPQAFTVTNGGNGDMNWAMSAIGGAGAARYTLTSSPPPGSLIPGASAIVTVSAATIASPAPSSVLSTFAAQVIITTDVPFNPEHVVTFGETPLGDQLVFADAGAIRFGDVPVGTSLSQPLVVENRANAGSMPAKFSCIVGGTGAGAYGVAPSAAPDGGLATSETIVFAPAGPGAYPATLGITSSDALCSPLPSPLVLSGTGAP